MKCSCSYLYLFQFTISFSFYSIFHTCRPTLDIQDVAKDDQHDMAPPRFIEVQKGKISLGPVAPVAKPAFEAGTKDKVRDNSSVFFLHCDMLCIKVVGSAFVRCNIDSNNNSYKIPKQNTESH